MDKEVIFIGQRTHAYNEAIKAGVEFKTVFTETGSLLEKQLQVEGKSFRTFTIKDKADVLEELRHTSFDILISNGCPIVFPVSTFLDQQLFINIHPTYLPHLKGKTPINGIFYEEYEFYGATMHFMDDDIEYWFNSVWVFHLLLHFHLLCFIRSLEAVFFFEYCIVNNAKKL